MQLDAAAVKEAVRRALTEDLEDRGDLTANAVISEDCRGSAYIVAKEPGVLAGIDCAIHACLTLDPECEIVEAAKDGVAFVAGDVVFRVVGRARALLAAE